MISLDRIKVYENWFTSFILNILGIGADNKRLAATFKNWILVRKNYRTSSLLAHELVHVNQYNELGVLRFLYRYLKYHFKYGYSNNPYEIEAYSLQNNEKYINLALDLLKR